MTLLEALDIVVAKDGFERYRHLCLEYPDEKVRREWSEWVMREAKGENPVSIPEEQQPVHYPCCGGVPLP